MGKEKAREKEQKESEKAEMKYICQMCGKPTDNDQSFDISVACKIYHHEVHRCDECERLLRKELEWGSEGETICEDKIICPYCNFEYEDYDSYSFDEGDNDEVECAECGRKFDLKVKVRRTYSTKRSLCEMPENYGEEDDEE